MSRLILLFLTLFSVLLHVHALPLLAVRQDALSQPTTLTTTNTQNTAVGQMVTTCEITLTPITGADGNPAVEQVTRCRTAMNGTNNGAVGNAEPSPAGQGDEQAETTVAEILPSSSVEGAQPEATTTEAEVQPEATTAEIASVVIVTETSSLPEAAAPTSAEESPAAVTTSSETVPSQAGEDEASTTTSAASTTQTAIRANGVSTVAFSDISSLLASATATAAEEQATDAPEDQTEEQPAEEQQADEGDGNEDEGDANEGDPTATEGSDATASAAEQNDASATESGSFELPGNKLSVLPIGLGVFAGISVIALIVVGLVTYERTKYRKAFRQRKLAEQGAAMGYSGNMAEVRA